MKQNAGFQQAFDAYATACATRPDCPVGTDPAQATARFQTLTRPLLDRPAPTRDDRTMSYPDAITGVVYALYSSQVWPTLTKALQLLAAGDGTVLDRIADLNGALLTVQGVQHTASFQGNPCVDDVVTRYLVDLTLPAAGAGCGPAG